MPIKRLFAQQAPQAAALAAGIETPEQARAREEYRQAEMPAKRDPEWLEKMPQEDFENLLADQAARIASKRDAPAESVGKSVPDITFDASSFDSASSEQAEGRMKRTGGRSASPRGGERRDLFQEVTDKMVQAIEEGSAPWQQPWQGRFGWPENPTTGKPYHGINVLMLAAIGYQDPRWCSYEQARKADWQVRAGEKSTRIYFYKPTTVDTKELDPVTCLPKAKIVPIFRSYPVFNLSQIDGAPKFEHGIQHEVVLDDVTEQTILDIIEASGAQIVDGRTQALYTPKGDQIAMPAKDTFESDAHYYAALFHEMAHWTGHESRLNRAFSFDKKSPEYAREELRAEMASAMISMQLGIPSAIPNHEGYVAAYLKVLRNDKKEIFRAAKDAETITRFILRYSPELRIDLEEGVRDQAQAAANAGAPDEFFDASLFDEFDDAPGFKP